MPPRLLILLIGFLIHVNCRSQQEFHGRITYHSGDTGIFSLSANCHFAPGKVRIDVIYPLLPGDDHAYAPFEIFDQEARMVYITEPRSRIMQKIKVDTFWSTDYVSRKRLAETRTILGYTCFGIESTYSPLIPRGTSDLMVRTVGWYAEKLSTSFNPPYPLALQGIIDDGFICLLLESRMFTSKDTSDCTIDFIALEISPGIPDPALFTIPTGYETIEFRSSEFFQQKKSAVVPANLKLSGADKNEER